MCAQSCQFQKPLCQLTLRTGKNFPGTGGRCPPLADPPLSLPSCKSAFFDHANQQSFDLTANLTCLYRLTPNTQTSSTSFSSLLLFFPPETGWREENRKTQQETFALHVNASVCDSLRELVQISRDVWFSWFKVEPSGVDSGAREQGQIF